MRKTGTNFPYSLQGSAGADPADTFDAWSRGKAKLQQTSMAAVSGSFAQTAGTGLVAQRA